MYYLELDDIQNIFNELHGFFTSHNDPLPHYTSSYHEKIESILARPQDTFDKKDLYNTIFKKAACYLYFINTLHPFMNGNKRMSIVCTYVFLRKNGYIFDVEEDIMYEFAKEISDNHSQQDGQFDEVVTFIKAHSRKIEQIPFPIDLKSILSKFWFWNKKLNRG